MLRLTLCLFALVAVWVHESNAATMPTKTFSLVHYGWMTTIDDNGEPTNTKEYRLAYGDTSAQEALAMARPSEFGPFAMNAAFYFHNPDGTWNLFNFRLPSESITDPKALEERQAYRDYLSRFDVKEALKHAYDKTDFGSPGEYIYKKMGLKTEELPADFKSLPPEVLGAVESIFQFNVDGTAKLFLRKPLDLEDSAQQVLEKLTESLPEEKRVYSL